MQKIVCFGDTITEMGVVIESRGFVAQLAERYVRRADVLARGFSGYTTREALRILHTAVLAEHPDIVILSFGMNDSALPGQIQHVPVEEYRSNLQEMATRIAVGGAWLILVSPPPLDERKTRSRRMDFTEQYALACFELGAEMNVPVVDSFHLIQQVDDWERKCLVDGLHLTAHGMDLLYEALVAVLDKQQPLKDFPRLSHNGL